MKLTLVIGLIALFGLAGVACDSSSGDCKVACEKLQTCNVRSAGLSCENNCDQQDCASCLENTICDDVLAGKCSRDCPGVMFSKITH